MINPEADRLNDRDDASSKEWKLWGPYLAERAWGTVREDYSSDGSAWSYFPHDHARSRAFRWSEDGLGAISDSSQTLCLAFAFWNGIDPILKERIFGLTSTEGNHGEDAKEYWWYLDSTPTHSWMRWKYHYPQREFPYQALVDENARRDRTEPEYELLDTSIFDEDRYWSIEVDYAKATPYDILVSVHVTNHAPESQTLHVIPTLWFRNTWSWTETSLQPEIVAKEQGFAAHHPEFGDWSLAVESPSEAEKAVLLLCNNETNTERLYGTPNLTPYPKDAINDHIVRGVPDSMPLQVGTKAAAWMQLTIKGGEQRSFRMRLTRSLDPSELNLSENFEEIRSQRRDEADLFYDALLHRSSENAESDEFDDQSRLIVRQAAAGLLWSKQLYHYDVDRWLNGDPTQPPPPSERDQGRNAQWRHLNNDDIISMPDTWEYPWYASWDLAFHTVALARLDHNFAQDQLSLLCREWYMHPNGQLPAYEWNFSDVNPPVHAWAALRVFEIGGSVNFDFLERIFHKLLINFTWWVNRKDFEGNNVFQGGFLGLDNIGPFDRSSNLPYGAHLEQSDGTAWMALYCLNMLEMAGVLASHDHVYEDVATKFLEHFAYISTALNESGLWSETDGMYYDVLHLPDDTQVPLRARSMVGLIPLLAATSLQRGNLTSLPGFVHRLKWFVANKPQFSASLHHLDNNASDEYHLAAVVEPERLRRILATVLSEEEFLSPFGIRSLSAYHRDHPLNQEIQGLPIHLDYEPGESRTPLFGGNSNWRGPVWLPLNYLIIRALLRYHRALGDSFTVEYPTHSGVHCTLAEVAQGLSQRLISLYRNDAHGIQPAQVATARQPPHLNWNDNLLFYEYFHGDTGAGLGASHQTGWTALLLDLILESDHEPTGPTSHGMPGTQSE